jgi:VanZ family protein
MGNPVPANSRLLWIALLSGYSAIIFTLSSQPLLDVPGPDFFLKDKLIHALAYGLMAFLAWQVSILYRAIQPPWLWSWLYASLYGVSDEWHQSFIPGRYADIWDWLADGFGAAMVLLVLQKTRQSTSTNKTDEQQTS